MNSDTPMPIRDAWIARAISLGLHAILLLAIGRSFQQAKANHLVVFSVETVSGLTPRGEGSGAEGTSSQMNNVPANTNPLAGGLHLQVTDKPVPASPKTAPVKASKPKPVAASPSLQDLSKRYEDMNIGLKPRHSQGAEEPSEGGMGNAHQAGAADGLLGLQGAIAGRGYRPSDYSYNKPLPEESEVLVQVTVSPKGEVIQARILRTSGYPDLDEHSLSAAREIVFDALSLSAPQEDASGTVLFRYEYNGHSRP